MDRKIIAVVGGPRAGKSFLVDKLAKHYNGVAILEEETELPERIRDDIQQNIRPLERIIWFRNKLVKEFFRALSLKNEGNVVVVDNFWISYQLYIDALAKDFEGEIIHDVASIDRSTLEWPDLTIFLTLSESGIRNFIKHGKRKFDKSEDFIQNQAIPIHRLHTDFFEKVGMGNNVLTIKRDGLDFNKETDFKELLKQIDTFLGIN